MPIRYPAPLVPGDTIAVTSPSSGVTDGERARLEFAIAGLRDRGFNIVVGSCMDGTRHVSAPARERARELQMFLTDPGIRAVVPPWGGVTAIDLLPLLDWEVIGEAEPTWFVGFSDISTLLTPLTLLTRVATVHGNNLMDTPYRAPDGLFGWEDITALSEGASFTQTPPGRFRAIGWDNYLTHPEVDEMTLDTPGTWSRFDEGPEDVDVTGRLIGGCIDTLCNVAGTPYGDVPTFVDQHAPEGLIVYVEASSKDALTTCRALHGMRLAGFFDRANAVLIGRTRAPDTEYMTQREAVLDALGGLGVPLIDDVECGHVQPFMPIVNGALGRVRMTRSIRSLTQTLA
ncbi:S66 peptidase family protein [Microbacterium keratanolyticum]|uniref:S66 family peptidase n=1 Tax=Microbacterium keratanolyticum TaxID=67574 RepID=UPI00363AC423